MVPEQQAGSDADPSQLDAAFRALRDRDRRFVLYFLLEHERASVDEVADVVTGWVHATETGLVEPQCRHRLHSRLVHTHLPLLVECDVVRYDADDATVSIAPCSAPVRELVRRACLTETGR